MKCSIHAVTQPWKSTCTWLAAPWGAELRGNAGQACTHVTQDSRRVRKGALFAVMAGATQDGAAFVPAALQAGVALAPADRSERTACCAVVRRALLKAGGSRGGPRLTRASQPPPNRRALRVPATCAQLPGRALPTR